MAGAEVAGAEVVRAVAAGPQADVMISTSVRAKIVAFRLVDISPPREKRQGMIFGLKKQFVRFFPLRLLFVPFVKVFHLFDFGWVKNLIFF
jgi:hypothetical protein